MSDIEDPPSGEAGGAAREVSRRVVPPRISTPSIWTKERDEELVRRWMAGGKSTAAIADLMGLTKNQVIGRAYRMNLPRKEATVPYAPRTPQARPRTRPHVVQVALPAPALEPRRKLKYKSVSSLLDLREDQCRFPLDKGEWCGQPQRERSPYCGNHHKLCYHKGRDP